MLKFISQRSLGHYSNDLIGIFNRAFAKSYNTQLVGGGSEPEYIPAGAQCDYHRIIFTQNYFASALHEIAHWCIAGKARRLQYDYGYWYVSDGRNSEQQRQFELVEVKPQAIECLFSMACGYHFQVSVDNLLLSKISSDNFKHAIANQVQRYCQEGVNDRIAYFIECLSTYYQTSTPVNGKCQMSKVSPF